MKVKTIFLTVCMTTTMIFTILLSLTLMSCVHVPASASASAHGESTSYEVSFSNPIFGLSNNATLTVKDYESQGIIFVYSQEKMYSNGNISGSKITYEMLMKEAQKLKADDVINIRVDVKKTLNYKTDVYSVTDEEGNSKTTTKTTWDYTLYDYVATALAIKYTESKNIGGSKPFHSMGTASPELTNIVSDIDKSQK